MKPRFTSLQRLLDLTLATALFGILSCGASVAQAGGISRSTGITQPVLADFAPNYAQDGLSAGYRQNYEHRLFLETLSADCGPGQSQFEAAVFSITLRRLSDPQRPSNTSRLVFWDRGRPHFDTLIWSPTDVRGKIKRLNFFLNALPPVGGLVVRSDGSNIDLLRDGRFSFSVHDDASVLQAQLHWKCAAALPGQVVDAAPVAPPPALHDHRRLHAGFAFSGAGRRALACPPVGSLYPRSPLETDALMKQLGPRADDLCRRQDFRAGYDSVRLLSCDVGARGLASGLHVQTEIVCLP